MHLVPLYLLLETHPLYLFLLVVTPVCLPQSLYLLQGALMAPLEYRLAGVLSLAGLLSSTSHLLVDYLQRYHRIVVTRSALSKLFKRLGLSWKRGKLKVTSPDPDYQIKRQRIETLKKSLFECGVGRRHEDRWQQGHDAEECQCASPFHPGPPSFSPNFRRNVVRRTGQDNTGSMTSVTRR